MLDHARLRVGAVQHGDLAAGGAVGDQALGFLDDPLRLGQVGAGFVHAHLFAVAGVGAQVLAQALAVVGDQHVGGVEDVAVRAVVLLQLDQVLHLELALEGAHIADVGAAEGVDALVVVADGEQGAAAVALAVAGQQLEPLVLQVIGILELVDQDVLEALLIVFAQRLVTAEQLVSAQQQLGEIDHAFALALVVVELVELALLALVGVVGFDLVGAQALVLGAVDEVHHLFRRKLLVVDVVGLDQALDGRQLVLGIEDLEGLRQRGVAVVGAQQAVAQAVEGADPHAACIDRQHRRQTRHHFLGRLVGEGDSQQARRRHLAGLNQPGDAGRQYTGFAGTGAREDQGALCRQGHGGELFVVEVMKKIVHPVIIPVLAAYTVLRGQV
ncbi:hypothetical protein DUGA2_38570 [Duganella sp. HH101]|nr:hypothetical protein DUGA2_38570 [Duganella sp. HH101]